MIETREFRAQDFHDMRPRMWEAERSDLANNPALLDALLTAMESAPFYTMTVDDVPVASFGLWVCDKDAEAWLYFTPDVRPVKKEFEATLATHLGIVSKALGLKTIRCGVIRGYEQQMPWVERLGFRKVGEKEKEVRYQLCL